MEIKEVTAFKAEDFRKWLEKNHKKETKVRVILHKKHTGKPAPNHRELMWEAICFGWIDTTVKRVDDDRYLISFSKRNKNSKWSDNTLSYAKILIKQGKMTEEGLKYYKQGLKKPTHDSGIPKNPEMPEELKKELIKDRKTESNFKNLSPSKKMFYRRILSGKLESTRKRRVKKVIELIKSGKMDFI
jgi:uncharacterized protein YdeI (YjbR/CyaY-like superfamily)